MMRFLPVNLDALLVELDDLPQTLALLASLQAEPIAGIEELVPAARTLLVRYRPWQVSPADAGRAHRRAQPHGAGRARGHADRDSGRLQRRRPRRGRADAGQSHALR